jgi:hypothetical protein
VLVVGLLQQPVLRVVSVQVQVHLVRLVHLVLPYWSIELVGSDKYALVTMGSTRKKAITAIALSLSIFGRTALRLVAWERGLSLSSGLYLATK